MPPKRVTDKRPNSLDDVLKQINSASLTSEVKSIFTVLVNFMKTIVEDRDTRVSELEDKLGQERIDNETKLNSLNEELRQCKSENTKLISQVSKMNDAHDELEAYGRRESLIFSGDKVKQYEPNENCVNIAKDLINNVLKISVDPLISIAHKMGKPPAPESNSPDKRPIIVKFVRRDNKFLIMSKARNKSTRVPGLYVNESLTPTRSKILYVLRQAKSLSNGLITGTSTLNGRVFAHHKASPSAPDGSTSLRTEMNTMEKLRDFCNNFIKEPLETFLNAQGR